MRRLPLLLFAACAGPVTPSQDALLSVGTSEARRYIVQLAEGANPGEIAHTHGLAPTFVYRHALNGFAASIPEATLAGLLRNPAVQTIEPDGIATVDVVGSWGLDRIDQRALPLNGSYVPPNDGSGVTVYVIDTGIVPGLSDFGGRAAVAADVTGGNGIDCHGHGTHVSGTIGSTTYGVAKAATLRAVKVFPLCSGSAAWSVIVAGIDWVTANAIKPAVANMSLGGGKSDAVNTAVANSIASGVSYAVAAGNNNGDACLTSPASTPAALTVAASDASDVKATFSAWGACVDLFAPGVGITSLSLTGSPTTWSGTSMATPHVTGVAALYLHDNPSASTGTVATSVIGSATTGVITNATGSPNRLLYAYLGTASPPPPPPECRFRGKSGKCK